MELATLITEAVKLSDDAHRANNAGHAEDAKKSLYDLWQVLRVHPDVFKAEPEPLTEPAPESPAPESTSDGD